MTWINSVNILPHDLKRVWYLDSTNGVQALYDGPVAGTASYGLSNTGYGPTTWQETSSIGISAESAKYKGDWTYEGFVYITGASENCLFNAGGWAGGSTEALNVTALVYVDSSRQLGAKWETGVNVGVTPSKASGALTLNTWYHVAVVKDSVAKTLTYYLNGVSAGTVAFSANPTGGDSSSNWDCRTAFGGYIGGYTLPNWRCACATFSTVTRDSTWMTSSYSHLSSDGILPTDDDTWMQIGPFLRTGIERQGVAAADTAYADGYEIGYTEGYSDGIATLPPGPTVDIISSPTLATDPTVVHVYSSTGELDFIQLTCQDRPDSEKRVVYETGAGFVHPFAGRSTVTGSGTTLDPYVFTVYRRGRWPTGIELDFEARAINGSVSDEDEV